MNKYLGLLSVGLLLASSPLLGARGKATTTKDVVTNFVMTKIVAPAVTDSAGFVAGLKTPCGMMELAFGTDPKDDNSLIAIMFDVIEKSGKIKDVEKLAALKKSLRGNMADEFFTLLNCSAAEEPAA